MIDVVHYLRGLADNIENGNIFVERIEMSDDLALNQASHNHKNKYTKTGIFDLNLTLRK
jgi:hypothetical protein